MNPSKWTDTIKSAGETVRESNWNKDIMSDPRLRRIVLFTAFPVFIVVFYFNQAWMKQEETDQAEDAAKLARTRTQACALNATLSNQSPTSDPRAELVRLYNQARVSFEGRSFENARDQAKVALDLAVKLNDDKIRLDCLELLADAALARGRTDAALEYYKQLSSERYRVVFKQQVQNFERAVSSGPRGDTERLAKLVCQMAELGQPNEATILQRAVAASQKGHLPHYVSKLKTLKS